MKSSEDVFSALAEGRLNPAAATQCLRELHQPVESRETQNSAPTRAPESAPAESEMSGFLIEALVKITGHPAEHFVLDRNFGSLGIDSRSLVALIGRLEETWGKLPRTLVYEHPSIERLATALAERGLTCGSPTTPVSKPAMRTNKERRSLRTREVREARIAIVGASGRYPGAPDLGKLHELLRANRRMIRETPAGRWDWQRRLRHDGDEAAAGKWGAFLDGVEWFDPIYYGIAPAEAALLAPEERLFLESATLALLQAGLPSDHMAKVAARTGVFAGCMYRQYSQLATGDTAGVLGAGSLWSIANRASHHLGLEGPSLTLDSACSSSLAAVIAACDSLMEGRCDMAVAGGVNLSLHPSKFQALAALGLLANDPEALPLGKAGGLHVGEGAGTVVLKRYEEAREAGDRVLAVIAGWSLQHGGASASFVAPAPTRMESMMGEALECAKWRTGELEHIELAASGMAATDASETLALGRLLKGSGAVTIGLLKANLGHLEAASGISQLHKALLQLRTGLRYPTRLPSVLNPDIDLRAAGLQVASENTRSLRRILINSFGAGGTLASLALEAEGTSSETAARDLEVKHAFDRRRCWVTPEGRPWVASGGHDRRPVDGHPVRRTAPMLKASEVHGQLRKIFQDRLGLTGNDLDSGLGFQDLGLNSVLAVQLIQAINEHFCLNLSTMILFDHADLRALAEAVAERLPEAPPSSDDTKDEINEGVPTCRALRLKRPQEIDQLALSESPIPTAGPGELLVQARAVSLNFGDLLCVRGLYPTQPPYPFTPGFEVAGVVRAVGSGVEGFALGDAIIALAGETMGAQAEQVVVPAATAVALPRNISFEEAVTLPTVFLTMWHAFSLAPIRADEWVLIQTATGGTGQVAMQLAKRAGARVIATAGSPEKVAYLQNAGVEVAINYRETDWAKRVLEVTGGRGVHVLFNTLAGDAIQQGLDCLAPGGRYIEIAMTGLRQATSLDFSRLTRNQAFFSVDMRLLGKDRPELIQDYLVRMVELLREGALQALPSQVFAFEQIQEAYRFLEDRTSIGKAVLALPKPDENESGFRIQKERQEVCKPRHRQPTVDEAIAIVGMSGRFPGASDLQAFWQNLDAGVCSLREVPGDRWDWHDYFDPEPRKPGKTYCRWGGFLDNIDQLDARFFGWSAQEASLADPQQRLFMEACYHALEEGGVALRRPGGLSCGVFVGAASGDYAEKVKARPRGPGAFWGNSASVTAARIAYFLDLKGPAVTLDTACSSSLVALHSACRALQNGDCEMALAGGVFVATTPALFLASSAAQMLSPTGRCFAFDARADGFVPGEGVGAVLLKPLSAAQRDGDVIQAVILGTAVNQDGRTYGITAPSAASQAALESDLYRRLNISPESIDMLEAHGTGTQLGDPIEVQALAAAFQQFGNRRHFCALGSVKTNIGHCMAAAGIAGLIKSVLALRHQRIPASLGFERPNPHLGLEHGPFYVNTESRRWEKHGNRARRAAVSSLGFSGTNAHVVLEEAPASDFIPESTESTILLPLSAASMGSLRENARRLAEWLQAHPRARLGDVAFTLQTARAAYRHRLAVWGQDREILCERLRAFAEGKLLEDCLAADGTTAGEHAISLAGDAQVVAQLERWWKTSDWRKLAAYWTGGGPVDWAHWPRTNHPRKVLLPGYAFERKRYWVDEEALALSDVRSESPDLTLSEVCCYCPEWDPIASPGITSNWRIVTFQVSPPETPESVVAQAISILERIQHEVKPFLSSSSGEPLLFLCWSVDEASEAWAEGVASAARSLLALRAGWASATVAVSLCPSEEEARRLVDPWAGAIRSHDLVRVHGKSVHRRVWKRAPRLSSSPREFREGLYLISGGLGGLGRSLADHILKTPGTSLLLLGRHAPEGKAKSWFEGQPQDRVSFAQADVCERESLARLLAVHEAEGGRLRGVFHLAGSAGSGHFPDLQTTDLWTTVYAKLGGVFALSEVVEGRKLDCFCVYGSASSVFGDFGQVVYGTANAWAGAFAKQLVKGCSVMHWPLWRAGGMRLEAGIEATYLRTSGLRYLETSDGLQVLDEHSGQAGEVLVLTGEARTLDKLARPLECIAGGEEKRETVSDSSEQDIATVVAATVRSMLGMEVVDEQASFGDLGFDSLTLDDLAETLTRRLGVPIGQALLLTHPTIGKVSACIQRQNATIEVKEYGTPPRPALVVEPKRGSVAGERSSELETIAVTGMACRFPGADSPEAFWRVIECGQSVIEDMPPNRMASGSGTPFRAGLIGQIDSFDHAFFRISKREAQCMDPQQRLLMQTCWHLLEDAGLAAKALRGRQIGVFVGAEKSEYAEVLREAGLHKAPHAAAGVHLAVLPNRISRFFDFRGPSEVHNGGCASSLVALHRGLEALRQGECEMAIVAGVNLLCSDTTFEAIAELGRLSASGVGRVFDEHADGMVRGEGVGAILLQPLKAARTENARIFGHVLGSSVNHCGSGTSLSAPSTEGVAEALCEALKRSNLLPRNLGYLEAMGTALRSGDPVEIEAFRQVFAGEKEPVYISALKPLIGHMEAAFGMGAVMKALLAVRHRLRPGVPGLETLSSQIHLDGAPLRIQRDAVAWPQPMNADRVREPRRAGVSGFGFGGTNVHVIVEEAAGSDDPPRPPLAFHRFDEVKVWAEPSLRNDGGKRSDRDKMAGDERGEVAQALETEVSSKTKASFSEVENYLRDRLTRFLCLDKTAMHPDQPMDELGFDSMTATTFMLELQGVHGPAIPLSAPTEHRTFRELSAFLTPLIVAGSETGSAPTGTGPSAHGSSEASAPELLPIHPSGTAWPSFWVHGAPGLGYLYHKLSLGLGDAFPLFAFQARGVDGLRLPFVELDAMVEHYVELMRRQQAEGPYYLGGYSYGGIVAYQMASRLEALGVKVGHLFLFDSYPPEMLRHFDTEHSEEVIRLQRVLNALMFFSSEHQIDLWEHFSLEELKMIPAHYANASIAHLLKKRTGTPLPEDHIYRFLQGVDTVCRISEGMAKRCTLKPFGAAPVTYFKSRELVSEDSPIAIPGLDPAAIGFASGAFEEIARYPYLQVWQDLVQSDFRVHEFDCDHLSLFEKENICHVADAVGAILRKDV